MQHTGCCALFSGTSASGPGSDSDSDSSSAVSQTCPSGSVAGSPLAAFNAGTPWALSCTARDISHYESPFPPHPPWQSHAETNKKGCSVNASNNLCERGQSCGRFVPFAAASMAAMAAAAGGMPD